MAENIQQHQEETFQLPAIDGRMVLRTENLVKKYGKRTVVLLPYKAAAVIFCAAELLLIARALLLLMRVCRRDIKNELSRDSVKLALDELHSGLLFCRAGRKYTACKRTYAGAHAGALRRGLQGRKVLRTPALGRCLGRSLQLQCYRRKDRVYPARRQGLVLYKMRYIY